MTLIKVSINWFGQVIRSSDSVKWFGQVIRSSDKILIKTFDQLKNDNFDQLNFGQVIISHAYLSIFSNFNELYNILYIQLKKNIEKKVFRFDKLLMTSNVSQLVIWRIHPNQFLFSSWKLLINHFSLFGKLIKHFLMLHQIVLWNRFA